MALLMVLMLSMRCNPEPDIIKEDDNKGSEEIVSDLAPEALLIGQHIRWHQSGYSSYPYDDFEIVNSSEIRTNFSSYRGEYSYRKTSTNTAIFSTSVYQPVSSTYRIFDIYAKLEFVSETKLKVSGSVSVYNSFNYSTTTYNLNCDGEFVK